MNLTPHFTLAEMTRSEYGLRRGVANTPSNFATQQLLRLCMHVLEPVRELLGVPLHINSGFRSELINTAVGGTRRSAHVEGRAADFVPVGMSLDEAFHRIRASTIAYDQLILECNAWLHISVPPEQTAARRQALLASGGPGSWTYSPAPPLGAIA